VFILSADETQKIGFVPAAKVDEEWNKETSNFDNEEVKEVDGVLSFPKASNKKQILSKEQLVSQVSVRLKNPSFLARLNSEKNRLVWQMKF